MSNSIWDNPAFAAGGEYVKFDKPGDTIEGVITHSAPHPFADGTIVPKFHINTADGVRTLTVGQFDLRKKLQAHRADIGDTIKIIFTGVQKLAGGKTLKTFDVTVTKGGDLDDDLI